MLTAHPPKSVAECDAALASLAVDRDLADGEMRELIREIMDHALECRFALAPVHRDA